MCGGTSCSLAVVTPVVGLSPRVRGNQRAAPGVLDGHRSIPACAGEPCHAATPSGGRTVYPRVCGGTGEVGRARCEICGLSPRVRGNRRVSSSKQRADRSIPACAGEPVWLSVNISTGAVYPRVCGGTWRRAWRYPYLRGLSPRVRGNRRVALTTVMPCGSIPACAGEPR